MATKVDGGRLGEVPRFLMAEEAMAEERKKERLV